MNFLNDLAKRNEIKKVAEAEQPLIDELYRIQEESGQKEVIRICASLRGLLAGEKEFLREVIIVETNRIFSKFNIQVSPELTERFGLNVESEKNENETRTAEEVKIEVKIENAKDAKKFIDGLTNESELTFCADYRNWLQSTNKTVENYPKTSISRERSLLICRAVNLSKNAWPKKI